MQAISQQLFEEQLAIRKPDTSVSGFLEFHIDLPS
jgi:hypothetical protein